jgi:signal transduction histidine kinase
MHEAVVVAEDRGSEAADAASAVDAARPADRPTVRGAVRLSGAQLWALALAAALCATALVLLIATSDFVHDRGLWIALTLVIGMGFAAIGLFAWYRRPDNRIGALMVATGFAWYLAMLERTDLSLLFSLGFWLSNLFVPVATHLLLAFPSGRLATRIDRALVTCSYAAVTLGFVPLVLSIDPSGLGCPECPDNVFAIDSNPSFAMGWLDGLSVVGILLMPAVIARLVVRWREAGRPMRRTMTPVFVAGGALMLLLAVLLGLSLVRAPEGLSKVVFYSALLPFGLVPYLFLAGLLRGRMLQGRGLGGFVRRLGSNVGRGELRAALADALGDPSVELAYWLPESEQYVDGEGHLVELPPPAAGRAVTEVEREGRRIAAIVHDPMLLDDPEHVREACAAAALALENERLEAELRAKVEEVRASRARLIEVGMRQRRRLERDLHDGAQQRLVSLALTLRLAQEKLGSDPAASHRLLEGSREELDEALKELRDLARGIHPALLSDRGLGPAIEALARRAPLPVRVAELPAERLPEQVEQAAYFVVSEALTNVAKYASATEASVAVAQSDGRLTVEVSDDGVGGADIGHGTGLRGLIDRLAAIDGRLQVDSEPGRGTTVRARIPLAD